MDGGGIVAMLRHKGWWRDSGHVKAKRKVGDNGHLTA